MKKTITINAMIFLAAMPISGVFALVALLNGFSPYDKGGSFMAQVVRYIFAPIVSGIMTIERIQTIIVAGPLVIFLAAMIGTTIKG